VHRKSNRWLNEAPNVMGTKFPTTVMVPGVVSNEGDVMPPHNFAKGLMIDTKKYLEVLKEVGKPWTPLCFSRGWCAPAQLKDDPGLAHGDPPEGLAQ